jgi:hypothetical protein
MGRLNRIEQILNNTINHYSHLKIFPRGLPRFADSLLRGTIRFGKRTGNTIALINPDNTFKFLEPPKARESKFTLAQPTPWIINECILSLGPERELHKVDDVVDTTILLKSAITQTYTTEDRVLLHSYPMLSSIDTNVGDTTIVVKSHYPIANGDVFAYLQTESLIQSLTEIKVVNATRLGTTASSFYTLLYSLELEKPIEKNIISNSVVYLRAYPAYFSAAVRIPNALFTSEPIGPFLIDMLSGKLLEGSEFNETLAIRTINRTGAYIVGSSTNYITINKNHMLLNRSIPAHAPMFWDLAEGSMRLTPTRILFKVDPVRKVFCAGVKCIPPLPADFSWRVNLVANEDCSIRFIFYPNAPQEFKLTSGTPQNVTVTIPSGAEITNIEINILSASDICRVQVSDWTPAKDTVEQIEYSFVVHAIGIATYQTSGIIIKPYFLGSEFLKTSYDIGSSYDGGKVYF